MDVACRPSRNPVLGCLGSEARALSAVVSKRNSDHPTAEPSLLVLQLAPKLGPALVEDRAVQLSLSPEIEPGALPGTYRRRAPSYLRSRQSRGFG